MSEQEKRCVWLVGSTLRQCDLSFGHGGECRHVTTKQSWLRARAERAAREANDGCAHDALCCNCAADAIEAVAREFAERALRDAMADWSLFRYDNFSGADVDDHVAKLLAAAEKGDDNG